MSQTSARSRVVVVSRGAPALGGIPAFAQMITTDPGLVERFDIELLNTTRVVVRRGGRLTPATMLEAVVDVARVFRRARQADVVHIQTALVPATVALRTLTLCAAAKLGGAAVLCHVHSAELSSGRSDLHSSSRLLRFLLRRLGFVDEILAVSRPGAEALRSLAPVRVSVVDNAVDVGSMPEPTRNGSIPTLLFVGTITARKGVRELLAAASLLRTRGVAFRLEVVGGAAEAGNDEADALTASFRTGGFAESLVGPLSPREVLDRMASADVFVLPSWLEGQPIAILEAMACGLPVVSTRTGAIPDVVRDGVDGFVVEIGDVGALADALERLISSSELRRSMGDSALRRARDEFDIERLRERLTALYRSAAAGKP